MWSRHGLPARWLCQFFQCVASVFCKSRTTGSTSADHSSIAALVALPPAFAPFSGVGEPSFSPLAFFAPARLLWFMAWQTDEFTFIFSDVCHELVLNETVMAYCICGMSQAITGTPCSKKRGRKPRLRVSRSILAMISVAFSRLQCSRAFLSSFR